MQVADAGACYKITKIQHMLAAANGLAKISRWTLTFLYFWISFFIIRLRRLCHSGVQFKLFKWENY